MLASNCSNDPIEVYVEKDIYLKNKGTKENEEVEKWKKGEKEEKKEKRNFRRNEISK